MKEKIDALNFQTMTSEEALELLNEILTYNDDTVKELFLYIVDSKINLVYDFTQFENAVEMLSNTNNRFGLLINEIINDIFKENEEQIKKQNEEEINIK